MPNRALDTNDDCFHFFFLSCSDQKCETPKSSSKTQMMTPDLLNSTLSRGSLTPLKWTTVPSGALSLPRLSNQSITKLPVYTHMHKHTYGIRDETKSDPGHKPDFLASIDSATGLLTVFFSIPLLLL